MGDKVLFPQLDYRLGEVVDLRAGQNPEYGEFEVITVEFGGGRRQRSFAAGLTAPHKLNADMPDVLQSGPAVDPQAVLQGPARNLPEQLGRGASRRRHLRRVRGSLAAPRPAGREYTSGHLNIAEAIIDMNQTALDTATLLKELDLPQGRQRSRSMPFRCRPRWPPTSGSTRWARATNAAGSCAGSSRPRRSTLPDMLRFTPTDYDPDAITPELEQLAFQLDDEWSDTIEQVEERKAVQTATIVLTFPHAMSGTLPLNRRTRPLLPTGHGERTMVMLVDGRWGNRFAGWVNRDGRYLAGLQAWMEKHKLPAGTQITLERRPDGDIVVDFKPKRMRRDWMRWAQNGDEGRFDIQLRKQEIACEYDEQMVIGAEKTEDLQRHRAHFAAVPLSRTWSSRSSSDLAGLSGMRQTWRPRPYTAPSTSSGG